jgi:integrase
MNFVEPIRDRKKIAQIKNLLRGQRRYRDLLLFVVGINTALRASDLLQLQIGHFMDDHQQTKGRFWIKEQKRGKRHEVVINNPSTIPNQDRAGRSQDPPGRFSLMLLH